MTTAKTLGFALLIVSMQCVGAEAKCSMANFEGFRNQAVDGRKVISSGHTAPYN
jgi:D-ribose pyranose/furanose isomerase RbsD